MLAPASQSGAPAAKIVLVGDAGTGKTCLLQRFKSGAFQPSHTSTIGVDFGMRVLEVDGRDARVQVWDTAGQERFRAITRTYYRNVDAMIVVFDVTDRPTFLHARAWARDATRLAPEGTVVTLASTKHDVGDAKVSEGEARELAREFGAAYVETSSADGTNVDAVFSETALRVLRSRGGSFAERGPRERLCTTGVSQHVCCGLS